MFCVRPSVCWSRCVAARWFARSRSKRLLTLRIRETKREYSRYKRPISRQAKLPIASFAKNGRSSPSDSTQKRRRRASRSPTSRQSQGPHVPHSRHVGYDNATRLQVKSATARGWRPSSWCAHTRTYNQGKRPCHFQFGVLRTLSQLSKRRVRARSSSEARRRRTTTTPRRP